MASTDAYRPNEYATKQRLHERYLIPPRTALCWRSTGDGPRGIMLGRRRFHRVSYVEEWLRAHTCGHRADELTRTLEISAARASEADRVP
jgi:hypothetical protein